LILCIKVLESLGDSIVATRFFRVAAMARRTEVDRINDPNFLVELAVGPPLATLVPQEPRSGIALGGQFLHAPGRFVFKKAHLSADDNRIFNAQTGQLVCVSHHFGKNPYDQLDPLGLSHQNEYWNRSHILGEWESICHVSGYHGMPSFKVSIRLLGSQTCLNPNEY